MRQTRLLASTSAKNKRRAFAGSPIPLEFRVARSTRASRRPGPALGSVRQCPASSPVKFLLLKKYYLLFLQQIFTIPIQMAQRAKNKIYLNDPKIDDWQRHSCPTPKNAPLTSFMAPRLHPKNGVFEVAPNLKRGFESIQIKIPQQIIVDRQKLKADFRQRQTLLSAVKFVRDQGFVPSYFFGRIQCKFVDVL